MQGGPLMSQHCTVDTYLCLRAIRTEGPVYRNVALKQYLQNMQTSVSVFGKNKTGFCCSVSHIVTVLKRSSCLPQESQNSRRGW